MEKLGIPAVLIATEPFVAACRGMAKLGGMPDQKFAIIQHPVGSLTEDVLRERAKSAAEQFIAIVTRG